DRENGMRRPVSKSQDGRVVNKYLRIACTPSKAVEAVMDDLLRILQAGSRELPACESRAAIVENRADRRHFSRSFVAVEAWGSRGNRPLAMAPGVDHNPPRPKDPCETSRKPRKTPNPRSHRWTGSARRSAGELS